MIIARDLHKTFKTKTGKVTAVDSVSFEARDGEITGLLGPNAVSYTHLDVYKRQTMHSAAPSRCWAGPTRVSTPPPKPSVTWMRYVPRWAWTS